jgi:hypothetical protein
MKERTLINLERLDDKQMDYIINMLYTYKKMNPTQVVYFNESQIYKCINLFKNLN